MNTKPLRRHSAIALAGLVMLTAPLGATQSSFALPDNFQAVGSGKLKWWGLTVYDAKLFAPQGIYRAEAEHALELDYRFSFSALQLAEESLKQIEKQRGRQSDRAGKMAQLEAVFQNVDKGDRLLGLHYPGRHAKFFFNGKLIGTLENPELAEAFFDIWLDTKTSAPKLRRKLIGAGQ